MRLAVSVLLFVSMTASAAPFAVQVGDTRLGLDAPPGFSDTGFTGSPRLQELAESLTSASNRILMFALTDADLRRFMVGDQLESKRFVVAVTPKGLERERITTATFTTFVTESLRGLGKPPAAGTDVHKYLDSQEGRTLLLAELRRDAEVVSIVQGLRLPSPPRSVFAEEKPGQYVLTTITLILLRGKALNLTVVGPYESASDLDWIRALTARWIEDLQRLNIR